VVRERLVPGTLSRDRIIDVALELSEREGLEALSMRRIAAELGTGAMSLYNHVPDKAALLMGLAERVLAEVEMPESASWREVAGSWATSLRATLLAHHRIVFVVVAASESQPLTKVSQALVDELVRARLSDDHAREVMWAVGRFVAGAVFLDAAYLRIGRAERAPLDQIFARGLSCLLDGLEGHITTGHAATT
jgi:TetR/AcrR family tetracycline transcriptional repressor